MKRVATTAGCGGSAAWREARWRSAAGNWTTRKDSKRENETGCDYCGLRGICGMERSEMAERCRELDDTEGFETGRGEYIDGMDKRTKSGDQ